MSLDIHAGQSTDPEQVDQFGRPITGYRNDGDLPGHYKATPERYRLFVDGERVNYYYPNVSQNELEDNRTGATDVFTLTPSGGQTVRLETAARLRYIVGYESEATLAMATNQELQGNDEVLVYVGRDDGYEFLFTADGAEIRVVRSSNVVRRLDVPTAVALTVFSRLVWRYNWYNVGKSEFLRSFTRNGSQFEPVLGALSVDGGRGPENANARVGVEVTPDANTSGLEVQFGSLGYNVVANVERTQGSKSFTITGLDHSGSDEWEPLVAFRHALDEQNVVVEFGKVEAVKGPGTDDSVTAQNVDKRLCTVDWQDPLDDGSSVAPRPPEPLAAYNSPIHASQAITEVPDQQGATVTTGPYNVARPGGIQVGHGSLQAQGNQVGRTSAARRIRQMFDPDYVVIFGKTGSQGQITLDIEMQFDY